MAGSYTHDIFYGTDGAWVMEALGDTGIAMRSLHSPF